MPSFSRVSISTSEKITFISNLSTMLSAGIPLLEAVESIQGDTKGNLKKVLESLKADLMQGKRVSASLASYPNSFDKVTVNLIKASEEAGTLEITLKDLRDHMQKEVEFADKVKLALIYPGLIMVVFLGVLIMILFFVVPKISQVFSRLRVTLPLPTRIMIFVSNIIVTYTWQVLAILFLLIVGGIFFYKRNKTLVKNAIFSLPLISRLVKEIDLTRFSRNLYLLLNSGLTITSALELSEDLVLKKEMKKVIKKSHELILGGKRFSEGFKFYPGVVPSTVVKLIEAGEKSGTLDKSMQEISTFFDYQVSNTLKTVTAMLEPIMLLLVGVSVGGMMLAIIAPIYSMIGQVGGR